MNKLLSIQSVETPTTQAVRCPNCGSHAERYHLAIQQITRTQCPACDYLMIICTRTGKVIEAYAPGIAAR
jgi:DNA-directed RNA polymerase subunit RPC12/RpoP